MRYVIAIDVGIKNLGLCVFDFTTAKFVYWDNVSLVPNGRYLPCNNVQYVRDFIMLREEETQRNDELLAVLCDGVVSETVASGWRSSVTRGRACHSGRAGWYFERGGGRALRFPR